MPSPRKRRLKRAVGAVMGPTGSLRGDDGRVRAHVNAGFVRNLVKANGAQDSVRGSAPFADGGRIRANAKIESGVIATLDQMDMFATLSLTSDTLIATNFLELTDTSGVTIRLVLVDSSAADGGEAEDPAAKLVNLTDADGDDGGELALGSDGDEILDNGASFSPKRFQILTHGGEVARTGLQLCEAITREIEALRTAGETALLTGAATDPGGGEGVIHLAQPVAGPAGNLEVSHTADVFVGQGQFGGGASAAEALHFFGESAAGNVADPITAQHGVLWVQNPRHAISGLLADGNLGAMVVDPIVPARIDANNPGAEAGGGTDRLHIRLICVDAIAEAGTVGAAAATVSDIDAIGISDTQPVADANQDIAMVQYVQAGNTTLSVDPAAVAGMVAAHAGGTELAADFFPSDTCGIILHWYLEPVDA